MRLSFSKSLEKLVIKLPANSGTLKERSAENFMRGVFNDIYTIFFLIFFIKAYVVAELY